MMGRFLLTSPDNAARLGYNEELVEFTFDASSQAIHFTNSRVPNQIFYLVNVWSYGYSTTEIKGHGGFGSTVIGGVLAGPAGAMAGLMIGRQFDEVSTEHPGPIILRFISESNLIADNPDFIDLQTGGTRAQANQLGQLAADIFTIQDRLIARHRHEANKPRAPMTLAEYDQISAAAQQEKVPTYDDQWWDNYIAERKAREAGKQHR
ncbi:hypothetical protein IV56_GL002114 [Lacticaseibacillus saniviri JCM 17471 = DSM 24301]|uniref:Uncharacterized protein n=3 Tax=Lacticaseibacillus saniviri TaxID=931533 RepID=A0A0R2MWG1_9LACO|nr:hypothetical protein IV56_GL002114 [Lacticaseibacillus saniviri JCM 17471 = DSM 24301]